MPKLNSAHTYVSGANGSVPIGMSVGSEVRMRFSYDASGNVVAVDYSTDGGSTYTTYYYVRNAQNDIVKLIDNSGNSVVEYTYDSWGKIVATTGSLANTVGANQPFRYRGYVYDEETGWYYLQSRYYDPTTCRFISADVYLSTGQGVIGHNSFAYCLNNSVNRIDASGAFSLKNVIDFIRALVEGGGGYNYGGGDLYGGKDNKNGVDVRNPEDYIKTDCHLSENACPQNTDIWSENTVSLYRVVSQAEFDSIFENNAFLASENSMEAKWFLTSFDDARQWSQLFYSEYYRIIEVDVPNWTLKGVYYNDNIDGVGPGYCFDLDTLNDYYISIKAVY